jgi:hypothetical protein
MDWDKSVVNTLKTIDYAIRKHPQDELDESEQALLSEMAQDYLSLSPQEAIQQNKVKPEIYVAEAVLSGYGRVNEQKLTRDAVKHCIAENIKQGKFQSFQLGAYDNAYTGQFTQAIKDHLLADIHYQPTLNNISIITTMGDANHPSEFDLKVDAYAMVGNCTEYIK